MEVNSKGLYLTSEKEKDNQSFMSYLCNDGKVQKCVISRADQERIKGTEKASSIHTLFHR